jgi:hypothetical protein
MSSTRLISSLEIVHRVDATSLAYTVARIKVLERIPDNPVGIACRTLDGATALMARNLPSSSFNSVVGMRKGQAGHLRQLEWYRERGGEARFAIAAGDYDPAVGRELTQLGFFQSGFHAALVHHERNLDRTDLEQPNHGGLPRRLRDGVEHSGSRARVLQGERSPVVGRTRLVALCRQTRRQAGRNCYPLHPRGRRLLRGFRPTLRFADVEFMRHC